MNSLVPQSQPAPTDQAESWYKVEAEYLHDCRAFDEFTDALRHFLRLDTFARLFEMDGAHNIGKIIVEKNG